MKKILFNILPFAAVVFTLSLMAGCNGDLTYNPANENPPVITDFSPKTGAIGTVVTVTGQDLHKVDEIKVGGQVVYLNERISNTQVTFIATVEGRTGIVSVKNQFGSVDSGEQFTYTYPAPAIDVSSLDSNVEVGKTMYFSGTNFGSVNGVFFTADGQSAVEAVVTRISANEIIVTVPHVNGATAKITLNYFNGTAYVQTPIAGAPQVTVISFTPNVTTSDYSGTYNVGDIFTLAGTNLDKIEKVTMKSAAAEIVNKQATELTFRIPVADFVDGDNVSDITIWYANEAESKVLTAALSVHVAQMLVWKDITTSCQGQKNAIAAYKDAYEYSSFFSPETGVHANSAWRTSVDAMSATKGGQVCSAGNKTNLTAAEYNTVAPYFFFTGTTSGTIQINSPANSASQLRNIYEEYGGKRVTHEETTGNYYGTPMISFRYLNSGDATEAALIAKVKDGTLKPINETNFVIDTGGNTIGGVSVASGLSGSPNTGTWAAGLLNGTDRTISDIGAVFMVLHHSVPDPVGGNNGVANVKRIGFLHIKSMGYRVFDDPNTPIKSPRYSDVTYDVYWQKYDYDYSKL